MMARIATIATATSFQRDMLNSPYASSPPSSIPPPQPTIDPDRVRRQWQSGAALLNSRHGGAVAVGTPDVSNVSAEELSRIEHALGGGLSVQSDEQDAM